MTAWSYGVGPWTGAGPEHDLDARARRLRVKLDAGDEAGFSIDGRDDLAGNVEDLISDLWIYRDGELLFRGRVGETADAAGANDHTVAVPAAAYRTVLGRRILFESDLRDFVNVDAGTIAWSLIDEAQARTGGNYGITQGTTGTGVLRERHYEAGKRIGEAIDQLSELGSGFDWWITPELELEIRAVRGTDREVVLDFGGRVVSFSRAPKLGSYGNAGRFSGADTLPAEEREVADLVTRPEGRWDVQVGIRDVSEAATLEARADRLLLDAQEIPVAYSLRLRSWAGPDDVWIGDPVQVVIRSGRLDVDTVLRVHELDIAIDDEGVETVIVTAGAAPPDPADRPRDLARRIEELERR